MLPMIFSVPVIYAQALPNRRFQAGMIGMIVCLFAGILFWLLFGYFESFYLRFDGFVLQQFRLLGAVYAGNFSSGNVLNALVQLEFFLYAVVMFSGTAASRFNWPFFIIYIPFWLLLVYGPIANFIWSESGWLKQLGALDFSGALVVHLTAGITSLVLAKFVKRKEEHDTVSTDNRTTSYIALFLILTGWFGFNLAPLAEWNQFGGLVMLNTLISVLFAVLGWSIQAFMKAGDLELGDLMNGVICGLVTSTAFAAYISPLSTALTAFVSGVTCYHVTLKMQASVHFFDAVDSFGINAVGGIVGTAGLIIFADKKLNSAGAAGLLQGHLTFPAIELLALTVTLVMTFIGATLTYAITKLLFVSGKKIKLKGKYSLRQRKI